MDDKFARFLGEHFSERELDLINNCIVYANNAPAGLPGHNLIIIIEKLFATSVYSYNRLSKEARDTFDAFLDDQAEKGLKAWTPLGHGH